PSRIEMPLRCGHVTVWKLTRASKSPTSPQFVSYCPSMRLYWLPGAASDATETSNWPSSSKLTPVPASPRSQSAELNAAVLNPSASRKTRAPALPLTVVFPLLFDVDLVVAGRGGGTTDPLWGPAPAGGRAGGRVVDRVGDVLLVGLWDVTTVAAGPPPPPSFPW